MIKLTLALISIGIWTQVRGCVPTPDPLVGLYIDLSAGVEGNGSECSPFKTFNTGLQSALSVPIASIVFLPSPTTALLSVSTTLATHISVVGSETVIQVSNSLTISSSGTLSLKSVTIIQAVGFAGPIIHVFGALNLDQVVVDSLSVNFFQLDGGSVSIVSSQFTRLNSPFCVIVAASSSLIITSSSFTDTHSDLIQVVIQTVGSASTLRLSAVTIDSLAENIIDFNSQVSSLLSVSIENTNINSIARVLSGNLDLVTLIVQNVSMKNLNQVMSGAITNSTLSFANCTFISILQPLFQLTSMLGQLSINGSVIRNVVQGPIVSLPVNTHPPFAAIVAITSTSISNVTNMNPTVFATLFCGLLATLKLKDLEVWDVTLLEGGLFVVTAGIVQMTNVLYYNSSTIANSLYELYGSSISMANTTLRHVGDSVGVITINVASTVSWNNIKITNCWGPPKLANDFVLLWSGYGSSATVTNSYFWNPGISDPTMAATNAASLHVYNTTWVESTNHNLIEIYDTSIIVMNNITFIRLNCTCVWYCQASAHCLALSNITFVDVIEIKKIVYSIGGLVTIQDSVFDSISANIFMVSGGVVHATNISVTNSVSVLCYGCANAQMFYDSLFVDKVSAQSLFQFTLTNAFIENSRLSGITAQQLVMLDFANVTFSHTVVENCLINSFGGLITAVANSIVNITHSQMSGLLGVLSVSIGLISLESSRLIIANSFFESFNSTLIYSVQSAVLITASNFQHGGLYQSTPNKVVKTFGGLLQDITSTSITITMCQFLDISADYGGVLYLSRTSNDAVVYELSINEVRQSYARQRGGVIYSNGAKLAISGSTFLNNSAIEGGVLWITGPSGTSIATISETVMSNNSANLNGGAITQSGCNITVSSSAIFNNSAVYGPNFALQAEHLSVITNTNFTPVSNYTIVGASGQSISTQVLIASLDPLSQVIFTDNLTQLSLYFEDSNVTLSGSTLLVATNGMYMITSLTAVGFPGTSIAVFGSTNNGVSNELFSISLRFCAMGEYYQSLKCIPCTNNMYSFSSETPCKLCPPHAQCTEGYKLTIDGGYWRNSLTTDSLYPCLVPELCLGGFESECTEGHYGVMCSQCNTNYYKTNQLQCVPCKSIGLSAFKGIVSLAFSVNSIIFALSKNRNIAMIHLVILDYFHILRTLVNFNVYWPDSLAFLYVVLGDIGSVGLSSFTDPCLGDVTNITTIYSQLIISILYFAVLTLTAGILAYTVRVVTRKVKTSTILAVVLYLAYLMLPTLFIRILQMFPCYDIEGVEYLIYNPSVKCWTSEHMAYTLGVAVPVFFIVIAVPIVLLFITVTGKHHWTRKMPKWEYFCLAVFLLRNYALSSILLFSNALTLSSQVSLVIAINIATEITMYRRSDCHELFFFSMYQSTLISSTLLSFFCVIYTASTARVTDKETAFILVNYAAILLPLAYCGLYVLYLKTKKDMRYVVPAQQEAFEDLNPHAVDPRSVVLEDDSSFRSSRAILNAPNTSPVQD